MRDLIFCLTLVWSAVFLPPAAAGASETSREGHVRFPVAHKHSFSWCYGYLEVTADTVRYEVVHPQNDQGHAFEVRRDAQTARQWTVLGAPQPGIEVRVGTTTQVFVWLANEAEVRTAPARRLAPPQALPPGQVLAALHGDFGSNRSASANPPPNRNLTSSPQPDLSGVGDASPDPATVATGLGPRRFSGQVGYVAPAGWSVRPTDGGAEMHPAIAPAGGPCAVLLLSPMPAQADLASQAEALVNGLFAGRFHGPLHAEPAGDVKTNTYSRYDGVSATGWQFVDLYGKLGDLRTLVYAHVLLAQMGSQVVPVIGLTNSDDRCMDGHDNATWVLLFHGLQLPGFTKETPTLKHQLIGSWTSVSSTTYENQAFAANGHFGTIAGHSTYTASSDPGFLLQTTSTWLGDGTYEVHGDQLMRTWLSRSDSKPMTDLISIVRRPNRERQGGFEYLLRIVQKSDNGAMLVGTMRKD
jgi:hypothetical protein